MLTLKSLPWKNLKGYAGRTAALILSGDFVCFRKSFRHRERGFW